MQEEKLTGNKLVKAKLNSLLSNLAMFKPHGTCLIMNHRKNKWVFSNIPFERLTAYVPLVDDVLHDVKFNAEHAPSYELYEHFPALGTKNLCLSLKNFLTILKKLDLSESAATIDINENGIYCEVPLSESFKLLSAKYNDIKYALDAPAILAKHKNFYDGVAVIDEDSLPGKKDKWYRVLKQFQKYLLALPELYPDRLRLYFGKVLDPIGLKVYTQLPREIMQRCTEPINVDISQDILQGNSWTMIKLSPEQLPIEERSVTTVIQVPLIPGTSTIDVPGFVKKSKLPYKHIIKVWREHNIVRVIAVFKNDLVSTTSYRPGAKWFPFRIANANGHS